MNDLGNADQAVWLITQGHWDMPVTNEPQQIPVSRLAVHANLIFYLIAPLYLLWSSPVVLLLLASMACTLAGYGLYQIAKDRLDNPWLAMIPALAFWLSPMVHDANLYDFHLTTFIAAFFTWMVWAFGRGLKRVGWLLFGLILICQENAGFLTLAYGIYQSLEGSTRKRGYLMVLVSGTYLLFVFGLIAHFQNLADGFTGPGWRYEWLKENFPHKIPAILESVLRPDRLRLPLYFLISGAIVALRQWRILLLLIPFLLEGMLSVTVWSTRISGTYYWITAEAIIVLACIYAAGDDQKGRISRTPLSFRYLIKATLVLSLIYSPLPYGLFSSWKNFEPSSDRSFIEELDQLIPPDAHLVAQNNVAPHFSRRDWITRLDSRFDQGDYVLIHLRYPTGPDNSLYTKSSAYSLFQESPETLVVKTRDLILAKDWGLLACGNGFYLFGRGQADRYDLVIMRNRWEEDGTQFLSSVESLGVSKLPVIALATGLLDWPWSEQE